MPHYHFHLRTNTTIYPDPVGTDLHDVASAREHGNAVANELMRNASPRTRHWSMIVTDGREQSDLFFADVDPSLDPYPNLRQMAHETGRRLAALTDVWCSARATLAESRMLLAKARRRPTLVYVKGE